ncbi:MAG: urea carboxylase [Pseudomonadota bacterium]
MFEKILIANRGEIACRIIRTLDRMGIGSIAVFSDADRHAAHVAMAGEAVRLGPAPAAESYLDIAAVLAACRATGAQAVHPGYGFLSENAEFAERLEAAGIRFIGPRPEHIRLFGLKHTARAAAKAAGLPLLPGTGLIESLDEAKREAARIGYPAMLKSTAGGGGIGLQLCNTPEELPNLYERVQRLAQANFGDGSLFLERFVAEARHVEVQIFGDGKGTVVSLGERDCSLQRRNQKVVEETPAPGIPDTVRTRLVNAAERLGTRTNYSSAGTVEFIYDPTRAEFYFLEVNTRLQVEHPVTEAVTGVDLLEWMVMEAAGSLDLSGYQHQPNGTAIEVRLYAEDPARDFRPSAGRITEARFPRNIRVDTWVATGTEVPATYDPLLAKLIATGEDRSAAVAALQDALKATEIHGIETNLDYLRQIAASDMFSSGAVSTSALARFPFRPRTIEVIQPGAQSSLQDWPGRQGYWHVGVPPSGPMDPLSHRLANRIVGNPAWSAVLEMTLTGPTLRVHTDALIALTGADLDAHLDNAPVAQFEPVPAQVGQVLRFGKAQGMGNRAYLAIAGGFDAPAYLGSRSTFTLGGFGGHATGALKTGDVLRIGFEAQERTPASLPEAIRPALANEWQIGVLYGPHGAPDFFTGDDIGMLLEAVYEVHFNSARTGVRLVGPKPQWAREDGGEAGLHPSNIHDNAYAVGALDFTGDMPIILGPDGPSLGGFVCPLVVAKAELWKIGQLKPGDTVRFLPLTLAEADRLETEQEAAIAGERSCFLDLPRPTVVRGVEELEPAIRLTRPERPVPVTYRRTGEDYLLIEFGPNVLDIDLRVRAQLLMERITAERIDALIDVTPGIRSLQLHYDNRSLSEARLIDLIDNLEAELPSLDDVVVPSRVVQLPLAWNDSQTQLATRKYQELIHPDAPWCPWNIEFIRRINGLETVEDVRRIVYGADYMVYGLGDVYLGAPVATPVDPRHRLVTTKYNPARTWTPENAVGIGGAYLCIYGMEGPGGYQFVGRTVQVWNSWRTTQNFVDGTPWLLRFFDRIRFFPVDEKELMEMRDAFPHGAYTVETEEGEFSLAAHHRMLAANAEEISAFRLRRETAFASERSAWAEQGVAVEGDHGHPIETDAVFLDLPDGALAIESPVPGSVWTIAAREGDAVHAGETLAVLESMKMEIAIDSPVSGRVSRVLVSAGRLVEAGEPLFVIAPEG